MSGAGMLVSRGLIALIVITLAVGAGTLLNRLRSGDLGAGEKPTATAAATATPDVTQTPAGSPTSLTFCGAVTRYASDGAHMLVTLSSAGATRQFSLEYQFAKSPPPTDIGDRLARGESQFVRVEGQIVPDGGAATTLRDFVVVRTPSCS